MKKKEISPSETPDSQATLDKENDASRSTSNLALPNFSSKRAVSVRITSVQALEEFVEKNTEKIVLLLFWAKWFPDCELLKRKLEEIQPNMMHMIITWCDVSIDKDIVLFFKITKVPAILVIDPNKNEVEAIKIPKVNTIAKVVGAYEELLRLKREQDKN